MFRRTKVVFIIFLFSYTGLYAQRLSQQVMVPAAGILVKNGINYQQTIGETAVELFRQSGNDLTQGYQQPRYEKPTGGGNNMGNGVQVYPNPAIEFIEIKLFGDSARKFRIEMINFAGTVIKTGTLDFSSSYNYIERWDAGAFKPGFYIMRVVSDDGIINRSFKIEKM